MADIDEFATLLLNEAKRFLEISKDAKDVDKRNACLHASLMLGFCSLEAHVNAIADDMVLVPDLAVHEVAMLTETDVRIKSGSFITSGQKFYRMEDKIEFIIRKFSDKEIDKKNGWWPMLQGSTSLRNELTHPKKVPSVTYNNVRDALEAIIATLDALYRASYKKAFPAVPMGLDSSLNF